MRPYPIGYMCETEESGGDYYYDYGLFTGRIIPNAIVGIIFSLIQVAGGMAGTALRVWLVPGLAVPPAPIPFSPIAVSAWFTEMFGTAILVMIYLGTTDKLLAWKTSAYLVGKDKFQNRSYINDYYGLAQGLAYVIISGATYIITSGTTVSLVFFVSNIMNAIYTGTGGPVRMAFWFLSASIGGGIVGGLTYLVYRLFRIYSYKRHSYMKRHVSKSMEEGVRMQPRGYGTGYGYKGGMYNK